MAASLVAESWTWYSLAWLVVLIRLSSQFLLRGSIKNLKADDAIVLFAMATDTVLIVCMNIITHTSSNLIDPKDHINLTPSEIKERTYGSKLVLVSEQMQILTIWMMKACLLIMYNRLTLSLNRNLAVKIVAAYVFVGFVVMEVLYLGVWCRPFSQYFAVPPDNAQCSAATNHLITNAVLNISSDIMIIAIPLPIFLRSKIAIKKKIILCCVFALGFFTILSAILNKYYSFSQPFGSEWTFWYIRESSTAIITANLPLTWTLFRRVFKLGSFNGSDTKTPTGPTISHLRSYRNRLGSHDGEEEDISASQERINRAYGVPLKIYQRQDFQVSSEPAPGHNHGRQSSLESLAEGFTTTIKGGPRDSRRNTDASLEKFSKVPVQTSHGV